MNVTFNPDEVKRIGEARESFSGLLLTDRQFHEVIAITDIIARSMKETGSFQKKLDDYSSAYAASERTSIAQANTMIRDLYRARTGETLKQSLDHFLNREKAILDPEKETPELAAQEAYRAANEVGRMVAEGTKMTFHRAFSYEASQLASNLGITDSGAKKLITQTFKETENREFREWGRELDETYYRPQIEAEKRQRQTQHSQDRSSQPTHA